MNNPLVSISCITYNHGSYIRECLEGFMMQQCNFDFEVLIHDDASTDETQEIIKEYQQKYPDIIKPILQTENQWSKGIRGINMKFNFSRAKGKYIAMCEGDDYWTHPLKLQKQVDFLEGNPDYNTCFHNVEEIDTNGKILNTRLVGSERIEKTYTTEDLANGNFIHTASVVFRRKFDELPAWVFTSPAGDYPLHMINASYGTIKYFPSKMAAYRIGQGCWSSQTKQVQFVNTIFIIKLMMANLKLNDLATKNFNAQIDRLVLHLKNIVSPSNSNIQNPEKAAYNLPIKKLALILLRKIRDHF